MKSELLNQIESLSLAEKSELLDALWASLETDAGSPSDAQRAELDRRSERLRNNPDNVISWEQVRANLIKEP